MAQTILGLDIGGANLKAATPDKRAVSVPFPLWKQPDRLPAALAELVAKFPDAEELAVTMTGDTIHPRELWQPSFWRAFGAAR